MEDLETFGTIQGGQSDDNPFQKMILFQGRNDFLSEVVNRDLTNFGLHFAAPSDFAQIDSALDPFEGKRTVLGLHHFGQHLTDE